MALRLIEELMPEADVAEVRYAAKAQPLLGYTQIRLPDGDRPLGPPLA